jgi:acetamidase/formamidase
MPDHQMLKRLSYKDGYEYLFSHLNQPRMQVELGESFVCETEDAFSGHMYKEGALPTPEFVPEMERTPVELNPQTGPVYINGVKAGDLICVNIEKVTPAARGFTCVVPAVGPLARNIDWPLFLEPRVFHFEHHPGPSGTTRDGELTALDGKLRLPLRPFMGTIAVAPDHEPESALMGQGPYGGNFDCRDIAEGNKVYLNVYHDGALLYIGDMHGSQGDTEFFGIANETRGEVQLSVNVIRNQRIPFPRIEKPDSIVQMYSYRPLEDAVRSATIHLMEWMMEGWGMTEEEAFLNVQVNPDFRINIYQCVRFDRINFTVGAELPKKYLPINRGKREA